MVDKIERLQKRAVSVYIHSAALSRGWFSRAWQGPPQINCMYEEEKTEKLCAKPFGKLIKNLFRKDALFGNTVKFRK